MDGNLTVDSADGIDPAEFLAVIITGSISAGE